MIPSQLSCDDPIIPELQAVVLAAGPGSRVTDISQGQAKCLMPVANRPLLYYPLKTLENAHFSDVIVVILETNKKDVPEKINRYFPNMNIEYFPVPDQLGTLGSLRLIADKIKTDVLVMSCDTITDYPLVPFINDFRLNDATLTCLLSRAPIFSSILGRTKEKTEKDLIGLDGPDKSRIVFLNSEADFVENVSIKTSLIKQCPNFVISRNLLDAHVYIIKKWVIDFIKKKYTLSAQDHMVASIKGELIPLLVREQFTKAGSDLKSCYKRSVREELDMSFEPTNGPLKGIFLSPENSGGNITCLSHMINQGFCIRANNATSYLEANKFVAQNPGLWGLQPPSKMKGVNDSVVEDEKSIGEKSTVRRSVMGRKSVVGSKVKLQDSVLMQKSKVHDSSLIENSVICSGATIGQNCTIKNCIVTGGYQVKDGEKLSNDVIGKHLDDVEV